MKRLVAFFKSAGVRWVIVDTDGNCDLVIPLFLEAGVDAIWPLERASDMDPVAVRRKYGRDPAPLGRGGQTGARQSSFTEIDSPPPLAPAADRRRRLHSHSVDHLVPPDIPLSTL
jgi:hypothetical protein